LIKLCSEKLFAFNDIHLAVNNIKSIRDEAAFLFTQLTTLRLENQPGDTLLVKKCIEDFQTIGQLNFIALEFQLFEIINLQQMGKEMLAQINKLQLSRMRFDYHVNKTCDFDVLDRAFLCGGKIDAKGNFVPGTTAWPALTELVLYDCFMYNIDVRCLADYFPRLQNLHLRQYPNWYPTSLILTNDPFRKMESMRVLKLDNVALQSFEMLEVGCMPLLEELYIKLPDDLTLNSLKFFKSFTRIDSFPHFPKLTKLSLLLKKIQDQGGVEWIDPKAFDHLTQLKSTALSLSAKRLKLVLRRIL
jgi:hypothetical protein